jgi:hypothetical protein
MPGCSGQHDQFPRRVTGERHPAGALRHGHHERHPAQRPLEAAAGVQRGDRRVLVLPQHHVVLEEHRVALGQAEFGHRHQLTLDLAGAVGEAELGHVTQSRRLAPARVGDPVPLVQRRATGQAAGVARRILATTPVAFDPIHSVLHSQFRAPQPARSVRRS